MEQSKRDRVSIDIIDFPILESMAQGLRQEVISLFDHEILEDSKTPYRYKIKSQNNEYELIFTDMGSFTLRPCVSERYRRNPPPLFYISVGKYSDSSFQWEDLNRELVATDKEFLKQAIWDAIKKFEEFA